MALSITKVGLLVKIQNGVEAPIYVSRENVKFTIKTETDYTTSPATTSTIVDFCVDGNWFNNVEISNLSIGGVTITGDANLSTQLATVFG